MGRANQVADFRFILRAEGFQSDFRVGSKGSRYAAGWAQVDLPRKEWRSDTHRWPAGHGHSCPEN